MKAVNLAQDMADRIRANSSAASTYAIAVSDTQTTLGNSPNCFGTIVTCTDTQMALYDKYEWDKMIYDSSRGMNLPGQPTRSITISGSSPTIITITLTWQEKSSGNLTYSMQIQV
jgi:Tfp pilus assembly protein PilV